MRYRYLILVAAFAAAASCSDSAPTGPPVVLPPIPAVLLKDIVISSLPSPFYHFEYDATDRITVASFASELTHYNVTYADGRLSAMQNNILVNRDRLVYSYDNAGRVSEVSYVDANGGTFTRVRFAYDGPKLTGLERERSSTFGFVVDKTMSMTYDSDGNLFELAEHHPAIPGLQDEVSVVDRYEQYDAGINVDGFSLIHSEFFDHLVLLPQVQLQRGNPRKLTRSGDGLNFTVAYIYSYDDVKRPLTKNGDITILNGPNAGQHVHGNTVFTYY